MNHTLNENRILYSEMTRHKVIILITLSFGILISLFLNILIGSSNITVMDILKSFLGMDVDSTTKMIILDIRFPMAVMAITVGAALGMGGCQIQTILRNPMASPYTLGISAAASFGAAMGIVMKSNVMGVPGNIIITINSFAFSMVAAFLIYTFSFRRNINKGTIILFGVALNFLFNSLTMLLQYIADEDELQSLVFWTFGSLLKATWGKVAIVMLSLVFCFYIFHKNAWNLTAMVLGDHKAKSLGVHVEKLRRTTIILVSVLSATAVCFVGTIGFIGLIAPHVARTIVGEDQRYFMPVSALLGAFVLSIAFIFSKVIVPGTILPIGLVTSFIGIPFFMAIIFKRGGVL